MLMWIGVLFVVIQAVDGIRDGHVTGVQTCALPILTVIGIGGNLIINVAQPALSVHHGLHGPAAVTEANAGSAIVGIFGPLAVGGAVSLGWGWKPAILVTAVLGLIAFFLIYPLPTAGSLDGRGAA